MIITSMLIMKQFIVINSDKISFDASYLSTSMYIEHIKKFFSEKILLKADFLWSKLSEHAKQYNALSAIDKILYEFLHAYFLKFCCNSSDFSILHLIINFSRTEAALFQIKEIAISHLIICHDCMMNHKFFIKYVIDSFLNKCKLINDACINCI